ncbi:MAG: 30S ribosomal protein S9 [Caldiserica bacterium]|nr:MAG: 30S ribosomal protein S9 [Caldisericota bacterium]
MENKNIIHAVGKRKTSIARVFLREGKGRIFINGKELDDYFRGYIRQKHAVLQPFILTNLRDKFDVKVNVTGGGVTGQAEAIRHGISRALSSLSEEIRLKLKKNGLLTRDARVVERKKPGRPKARKNYQYSKR